jgi:hypothetical protein
MNVGDLTREPSREVRPNGNPGTAVTLPPPRRSGAGRLLGTVVGLLVIAAGAIAAMAILRHSNKTAAPPPAELPAAQVRAPQVELPPPPAAPTVFHMTIHSTPSEAEIFQGNRVRGRTPARLELQAGSETIKLVLRKKGFVDRLFDVTPTSDQSFEFDLQPVKPAAVPIKHGPRVNHPAASGTAVRPVADPNPPQVAPKPTPPPVQPTPPKPSGKLRDLKDPFSQGQ